MQAAEGRGAGREVARWESPGFSSGALGEHFTARLLKDCSLPGLAAYILQDRSVFQVV